MSEENGEVAPPAETPQEEEEAPAAEGETPAADGEATAAAPATEDAAPEEPQDPWVGTYKLVKNENFDAFLQANGAGWMVRKMATSSNPTLTIQRSGEDFTIKLASLMKSKEEKFTVGTEFEQEQHNGSKYKVVPSWDGEKLVMEYTPVDENNGKKQKVTREKEGDTLTVIMEIGDGDVVAKRIFQKQA